MGQLDIGQSRERAGRWSRAHLGVALACLCAQPLVAGAQDVKPQTKDDFVLDEIVVTASRIQRAGFTAPTPTTVINLDDLERMASISPADFLNQYVPSMVPSVTPATGHASTNRAAGNAIDLRGLGARRTLTLLNGHRHVATSPFGTVDMDVFPTALIERVDVVTGGASAAYGSDAVAGVVNVILKDSFEGFDLAVQSGISDHNDNEQLRASVAYGTAMWDDRANIMLGIDHVDRKGVSDQGRRDWGRADAVILTPIAGGAPSRQLFRDVNYITAPGGFIVSGPLAGTAFGPGGSIEQFQFGTRLTNGRAGGPLGVGALQTGGGGVRAARDFSLIAPSERSNAFLRGTFDFTEDVKGYLEASYASSDFTGDVLYSGSGLVGNVLYTVQRDNPFLPAQIAATMDANGLPAFGMTRIDQDLGILGTRSENDTQRYVLGARGRFAGNWAWDVYWQRGENRFRNSQDNRWNARWAEAADAVLINGVPGCRNAAARAAGCSPLNVIGTGPQSAEALSYIGVDTYSLYELTENVYAASLQGEAFSTWAGPVSVATGVERRETDLEASVDPHTRSAIDPVTGLIPTNVFTVFPMPFQFAQLGGATAGADASVTEAFAETVVPLANDLPFARLLEFNGAYRWTDYSQSGEIDSWKLGLSWKPFADLRFRATRSRDIRAPSLFELHAGGSGFAAGVSDPVLSESYLVTVDFSGNRTLVPEEADTTIFGLVYEPSWASGLSASVDVYEIEIDNAIGSPAAQTVVDRCAAGEQLMCAVIVRDPAQGNRITRLGIGNVNFQTQEARGMDFELSYRVPLAQWSPKLDGNLSLRLLGNHTREFLVGSSTNDLAGSLGVTGTPGGVPEWRGSASATYDRNALSMSVAARYIGAGDYNTMLAPAVMAPYRIPSQVYWDTSVRYEFSLGSSDLRLQLFGAVQNLTDRDPPLVPLTNLYGFETNATYYDVVGRMYSVGARVRY